MTFKFEYRKVKGITMDLEAILKVAREEIANETKLIRDNQGTIVPRKGRNIFPSFLNLNRDSSEANRYRISLYGALKLSEPD